MSSLKYLPFHQEFTQSYCPEINKGKVTISNFPYGLCARRKFADKTSVLYLCRDKANLYFLFKRKVGPAGLRNFETKPPLWRDDTAELFLDLEHSKSRYYRFAVNPLNKRECNLFSIRQSTLKWSKDSQKAEGQGINWSSSVRLSKNEFLVLMMIPFNSLKLGKNKAELILGFNALLHKANEGEDIYFENFKEVSGHAPWAFDELLFQKNDLKVKSIDLGNVEMDAPNLLTLLLENTGKKAGKYTLKVSTFYGLDFKEHYSDSLIFTSLPGRVVSLTLQYFLHPGSNCLRSSHKVSMEILDASGALVYTRQALFGYALGFPIYYGKPAGKVKNPAVTHPDFVNEKRTYIVSKLPGFKRWKTPEGAPSDFCIKSLDGKYIFNLMRPDALKQIAEFIHKLFDNDIDRLLAANMLLFDPAFMIYNAKMSLIGGRLLSPLSILRFGTGGCDTFSEVLLGLLENLRIGKTKKCYTGHVLGLSGHVLTAVKYKGKLIPLDPSMGTFFYRWNNKELASVDELMKDSALVDRAGIDYSKDFFQDIKKLSLGEYGDVIWP